VTTGDNGSATTSASTATAAAAADDVGDALLKGSQSPQPLRLLLYRRIPRGIIDISLTFHAMTGRANVFTHLDRTFR